METTPTFLQRTQTLFFAFGVTIFMAYLFFSISDGAIFYSQTGDMRPLLTASVGRFISPDYYMYLSLESIKTEGLSKEAIDATKLNFFISAVLLLSILGGGIIAIARSNLTMPMRLLCIFALILGIGIVEMIYVYAISHRLIIPYAGVMKIFTQETTRLLIATAGSKSIESTILLSKNVTVIM